MNKTEPNTAIRAASHAPVLDEPIADEEDALQAAWYRGVDLAPSTLDTLVTWDVSNHAQRERDRLSSAARAPEAVKGGY
jgi:hypothetical protein